MRSLAEKYSGGMGNTGSVLKRRQSSVEFGFIDCVCMRVCVHACVCACLCSVFLCCCLSASGRDRISAGQAGLLESPFIG